MGQDQNNDRIILRQEILLPVGWTLSPSNGSIQVAAAPPSPAAPPPQSAAAATSGLDRELLKAIAAMLAQRPGQCGCQSKSGVSLATGAPPDNDGHYVSTPTGSVDISSGTVTSTGYSRRGGNGPIKLCAQVFQGCESGAVHLGMGYTEKCITAGSGEYLNEYWMIEGIEVGGGGGPYTIRVTATFIDNTQIPSERCFLGTTDSGSGPATVPPPVIAAASAAVEHPPSQTYAVAVEEAPGSIATLFLKLDPYCTTPEQPIWRSPLGSGPCEWLLKVGRHSQRLYGALIRREANHPDMVWLSDDFRVGSENTLSCETGSGRTAIVRPA